VKPYTISSDQHCHAWSQFSQIGGDGVNSRLRIILNELERQAATVLAAGGDRMFLGGDLFHTRGNINPEVLNPTIDAFKRICASGVDVYAITGNHDLSTTNSTKLGNAMQALDEIDGFCAIVEPELVDGDVMMIPWIDNLDDLTAVARKHANAKVDLIIHAPLNGVILGLPDHGLDPISVSKWGYRRVFVGHYHSHREPADSVFSIGATSHQTWSDPGTLAGFLMVDETTVTHHPSAAPKFVNIDDPIVDVQDVKGNYCRIRLQDVDPQELDKFKADLKAAGAAGIVDHSVKKRDATRGVAAPSNVTLEVSVANFIKDDLEVEKGLKKSRIAQDALDVLREARTVGGE
jgi:DNA repair exonuclease SbcCD nuclease subunit